MAEAVSAKINGIPVWVPAGTYILDAARKLQIKIPVLVQTSRPAARGFLRTLRGQNKGNE